MVSIEKALTPDQASVVAYAGKVKQTETVTLFLEDGTAVTKEVNIVLSWETIQEVMALICKRAGIRLMVYNQKES